jgi:hypothetical protein
MVSVDITLWVVYARVRVLHHLSSLPTCLSVASEQGDSETKQELNIRAYNHRTLVTQKDTLGVVLRSPHVLDQKERMSIDFGEKMDRYN